MQEHRHDENQSFRPAPTTEPSDRVEQRSPRDQKDVERFDGEGGSQSTTAPPADESKQVERKNKSRRKPIA
jgi:hypothetical protein